MPSRLCDFPGRGGGLHRHDFRLFCLVYAGRVKVLLTVPMACALAMSSLAQTEPWLKNLLPTDATIIETANLSDASHKPRLLVLWMDHPRKS
jgi:hypothetical protein